MNRWLPSICLSLTCLLQAQEPDAALTPPPPPPAAPSAGPTTTQSTPPASTTPTAQPTTPAQAANPGTTPDPAAPPPVRAVVLGYHDFSTTEPETEMRINTDKFRKQMEFIRDTGCTVLSLDDFTAWKRGEKTIPDKSVLITIDDGWKSLYEQAFPILKEFKYPFTLFLYTNYINGGGKALTSTMIRDMKKHGATIASHSVSHPYPVVFRRQRSLGAEPYATFLRKEMGESKQLLESKFSTTVHAYSYPGGYVTEEMWPILTELGYQVAFTIQPGKTTADTPILEVPRYMILGTHDRVFELAMSFESPGIQEPAALVTQLIEPSQRSPYPVLPEAGAIINTRLPEISADLSKAANLDPATLEMRVSGFAKVPATFDAATGKLSWQVNRRLRQPSVQVTVTWKDPEGKPCESPLEWSFQIDREAAYLIEQP